MRVWVQLLSFLTFSRILHPLSQHQAKLFVCALRYRFHVTQKQRRRPPVHHAAKAYLLLPNFATKSPIWQHCRPEGCRCFRRGARQHLPSGIYCLAVGTSQVLCGMQLRQAAEKSISSADVRTSEGGWRRDDGVEHAAASEYRLLGGCVRGGIVTVRGAPGRNGSCQKRYLAARGRGGGVHGGLYGTGMS